MDFVRHGLYVVAEVVSDGHKITGQDLTVVFLHSIVIKDDLLGSFLPIILEQPAGGLTGVDQDVVELNGFRGNRPKFLQVVRN